MDTPNDNFTFTCPHCEQRLEAESDMIGMELDCPTCGQKIIVPVLHSDETESKGLKFVPQMTEIPSVKKEFLKRRWSICSIKLKLAVVATAILSLFMLIICIFGRMDDESPREERIASSYESPREERITSSYAVLQHKTVSGMTWRYILMEGEASIEDPCGETHFPAIQTLTSGVLTIPPTLGGYPVTSIGHSAFKDCSHLTCATIPDSVTSIGDSAFEGCRGLTSVTIPNSVTSIGWSAFNGCNDKLFDMKTIPGAKLLDGCVVGYDRSLSGHLDLSGVRGIAEHAFKGCSGLTSVTIPNSVTSIGNCAFDGCRGLMYVTIPNSVTSIRDAAFAHCSVLTSVTIPNSVTSIGNGAFAHCNALTSVTIPNSVTSIGDASFLGCSGLMSVTIPNSVTSIGNSAFEGCSGLMSITIPDSVTSIGNSAFEGCSGLTSVTIPNSVTSIGINAFRGCNSLFYLPDYVVKLMVKAEKEHEKRK